MLLAATLALLTGCATTPPADGGQGVVEYVAETSATSVLGADATFAGSPLPDVGLTGLFPPHGPDGCQVAVLQGGEDSFAVRLETLRNAQKSIRIQALVFKGDETGLRVAEILKQKKAAGLDVRVIVDAFSNPWLQTQWMFFDLKQNGIEVEGYEAMALQWLNEVPIPALTPHTDPDALDKRFHEKMWIIDGETDHAIAVTGGLNIGNEYFRAAPDDPNATWRDQDVVLRGAIVRDLVTAFDRNFDYFVEREEEPRHLQHEPVLGCDAQGPRQDGQAADQLQDGPGDRRECRAARGQAAATQVPRRHLPVPAEPAPPAGDLYPAGLHQADRAREERGTHRERVFRADALDVAGTDRRGEALRDRSG